MDAISPKLMRYCFCFFNLAQMMNPRKEEARKTVRQRVLYWLIQC